VGDCNHLQEEATSPAVEGLQQTVIYQFQFNGLSVSHITFA
jgi:hypothetical protein